MTEQCGAENREGEPCSLSAGWGTDHNGEGRCKFHGGASSGGAREGSGAPKGNGNAITHGARSSPTNLYRHLDDDEREWVDQLVESYLEEAPFGEDSAKVERLQMTCTVIYQEWSAREVVLREGPSEEITMGVNEAGMPVARTDEHHLTTTASNHNQTVRMNLKDLGLLDSPEQQQAESMRSIADILSEETEE